MDKLNYALVKLAEEASEVIKESTKCITFGLESRHPDGGPNNIKRLGSEIDDFLAVIAFLEGEINKEGWCYVPDVEYINYKVDKLNSYYNQLFGEVNESI